MPFRRPSPVVLMVLDGWGYQDTHETLNSFIWGPDGWLYGCQGVFTHSLVGKPGTPDITYPAQALDTPAREAFRFSSVLPIASAVLLSP